MQEHTYNTSETHQSVTNLKAIFSPDSSGARSGTFSRAIEEYPPCSQLFNGETSRLLSELHPAEDCVSHWKTKLSLRTTGDKKLYLCCHANYAI